MKKEELYQKYPALFRQTKLGRHESCMYYGIECGDGWLALIDSLSDFLSKFNGVEYAQIKEKFGTLTVYLDFNESVSDDTIQMCREVVAQYSTMSATTCEICGNTKAERSTSEFGWIKTLCPKHTKERDERDKEFDNVGE